MIRTLVIFCVLAITVVAVVVVRNVRHSARTVTCNGQLRLVSLLVHRYASEHGKLPRPVTRDSSGRALQSWRLSVIQIHEYLDFSKHMDVEAPWTAPANREFLKTFDDSILFNCPSVSRSDGITTYLAIVGKGTAWDINTDVADIRDETLLIVEWPNSDIYWAEPRDITLDEFSSMLKNDQFRTEHSDSLRCVDWSGTVHEIPLDNSSLQKVRKLALVPASNTKQGRAK